MRRFDEHFTRALVRRLHASVKPDGLVVHIHDTACWSATHEQPVSIEAALANPEQYVPILNRHDACDTVLHARALGATELTTEGVWWLWPLEPNKQFLVRAGVFAASLDES
jgi:hypothetical protein